MAAITPVHLLVLSDESSRQLKMLSSLSGRAEVMVSNSPAAVKQFAASADALLYWDTSPEVLEEVFPYCKKLRWMHSKNAGLESILFPSLVESDVVLTNSGGVYARSLAEFALSGMLYFAKDIPRMQRNQREEHWEQYEVEELAGKTLGIFGYGGIGQRTAERAKAFGMRVIAIRRSAEKSAGREHLDEALLPADKDRLCSESDYLLLSSPLTAETRWAFAEHELSLLKPSAVLINLGRGPIVKEDLLVEILKNGRIRGAVLDVFDIEPLPKKHPFWSMPNVLISPHTADQTATWKEEAMQFFLDNFERFLKGSSLVNVCDKRIGY